MKINVVSKKLIKPSTPTPENLKNYIISFLDENSPTSNISLLLFYTSKPKHVISQLEESLAKILVQFYPLAGRYVPEDFMVDCSDQGAEFVEAFLDDDDVEMVDVIGAETTDQLGDLLPRPAYQVDYVAATTPLLSIQVTEFKCGGMVIGISISHKIFDAASVGTFITVWSNASMNPEYGNTTITPTFDVPSLLPCKKLRAYSPQPPRSTFSLTNTIGKRFLFNKEAVMSLKSKLRPKDDGQRMISKVRVVSAVIAKVLMVVYQANRPTACVFVQPVSMRVRTTPSLPIHSCGNLAITSVSRCVAATEAEDITLQDLVSILGDAIDKTINDCAGFFCLGEDGQNNIIVNPLTIAKGGEVKTMWFSDCTKFGFYEADFGWGKPVSVGIVTLPVPGITLLMNNREGDGIEAWVHLSHKDMSVFEQDDQIKSLTN